MSSLLISQCGTVQTNKQTNNGKCVHMHYELIELIVNDSYLLEGISTLSWSGIGSGGRSFGL